MPFKRHGLEGFFILSCFQNRGSDFFFRSYNANPINARVGDCTVRAISTALDQSWKQTYTEMSVFGYLRCDMPSADHVWNAYLRSRGWGRAIVPDECPDCYSVKDFCRDHPEGRYILAIDGHVVAVINGDYYDTWDSGNEIPIYYWYKKGS